MSGKGRGKGSGRARGVRKEDRVFTDVLSSLLEEIVMADKKLLAEKCNDKGLTIPQKTKYWEEVRLRLSDVSGIDTG